MTSSVLVYSPHSADYEIGFISFQGDNLIHHINGQTLVDPVYTVSQLQYTYPLPSSVTHPERGERVRAAYEALQTFDLVGDRTHQLKQLEPRLATEAEILRVHAPVYLQQVQALSRTGGELGKAAYVGAGVYESALLSAGSGLTALELLKSGQANNALVLTRPPGHHAAPAQGAGFCIFNNVAVLAKECQRQGWQRVLIVDWDLHHGDGTQAIFYDDPAVMFCSLHQFGPELYPETGDWHETGQGQGLGYTVNLPLPAKLGDATYLSLFKRVIPALADYYRPDIILVSAGYDGHFNDTINPYVWDPGGGLSLSAQLYHTLTRVIADCASRYCEGRYIIILEGGYNLHNLTASLVNTASAMLGQPPFVTETIPDNIPQTQLEVEEYLEKLSKASPLGIKY